MRSELPTGTVTFLFTDIEGSTRLLHDLGPAAYADALAGHRRLLRDAFEAHGGVEVDTQGDAFFVAFPTAEGAAAAAVAGAAALGKGPIRVRIGLHTGTPAVTAEGYVGADVHLGARVAGLAHGGQVLLTEATRALLSDDARVLDLGLHRLKDVDSAVRVHQLGPVRFPALRSPGVVDLPVPASRFVGRRQELFDAVARWHEHAPRVLTIVGTGGTGKTRFAIELGRRLADEADGGTFFVPLAPLRDAALVMPTIADALGVQSAEPGAVAARVGDRRTHLVLDNLEQLLPDAARPLADLVAAAPELRLLVTSREPLRVSGEVELDLPPMSDDDGVVLFLERAGAVRGDVRESPAVHELVRRLDGLPLALELAAARSKLLDPERLLARLGGRLDTLAAGRDAEGRHATLRATIAWSHDLLDAREQELFARLAVFRGGFTIEAAEETCDAELDTLASLLDKSLLRRRTGDGTGEERFWMLETIRAFAAERLQASPEEEQLIRRRHARRVLAVARAAHLSSEDFGRGTPGYESAVAEREEVRGALDWALRHDRELSAEIVVALEGYWVTSAPAEAFGRVDSLLADGTLPTVLRARLLRLRGGIGVLGGEQALGEECYRESLELFRELGDERNEVALLGRFAVHAGEGGEPEEARRLVAEVRKLNETVANPVVEPQMLSTLAQVAAREGDEQEALRLTRESVAAARACEFRIWELWQLDRQAVRELELGLLDDAERTGREGLELARRLDDHRLMRTLLASLALVALRRADPKRAGTLWGAVDAAETDEPLVSLHEQFREVVAPLHDCADPRFLAAVDKGRALPTSQAVAVALDEGQTVP